MKFVDRLWLTSTQVEVLVKDWDNKTDGLKKPFVVGEDGIVPLQVPRDNALIVGQYNFSSGSAYIPENGKEVSVKENGWPRHARALT